MKGFVSLLKGRKFKSQSIINSSFLIKSPKEEKENLNSEHIKSEYFPLINNIHKAKTTNLRSSKKLIIFSPKKNKINDFNYEELFFYFLKTSEKIDNFESSPKNNKNSKEIYFQIKTNERNFEDEEEKDKENEENPKNNTKTEKNIPNLKGIFYHEIFLKLTNNKQKLNNFSFPIGIYKLMYQKSRKKQKEILKHCLKNHKDYKTVITSYGKCYTNKTLKHNWELSPNETYSNYYKIYRKKFLSQKKEPNKNLDLLTNYSDVVIKANNKGQGRTLIYIGKLFNAYVEDYLKKNKNVVSMYIENPNDRKEVVYNHTDIIKLSKMKMNFSYNKNKSNNYLYSSKNNLKYLNKRTSRNSDFNLIFDSLNNKNNSELKRLNTESNKFSELKSKNFSFNSLSNYNQNSNEKIKFSFTDKRKDKKNILNNRIEKYKSNINYFKNNDERFSTNKLSFSPFHLILISQ